MNEDAIILDDIAKEWQKDPVFFVEHALGHKTWSRQREILKSIKENEKTIVRACHGSSKTYTAAEAAVWFLNCFENSKVITTAPTYTQVAKLLWAEINKIYMTARFQLRGECLLTEIKGDAADHYAIGFSTDKPARAEGWHAPAIFFIFDEAKGIPAWLWDTVRGLLTGGFCRWLAISTTDGVDVGENFYNAFKSNGEWNQIHISAHDSPYLTGEKFHYIDMPDLARPEKFEPKKVAPEEFLIPIVNNQYIVSCKRAWGEDSPLFKTKVLGEFSDIGADTIIKLSEVEKMFANAKDAQFDLSGQLEAGVDVAYGGQDDSVFYLRKGMKILKERTIPPKEMPPQAKIVYLANELEEFVDFNKEMAIKIDDTGIGGGLTSVMEARNYNIIPINFQASPAHPDMYPNIISEMWFQAARIINELACPEDERLRTELVNRKYRIDKKGRRMVESKDDYRARGFASPDKADAFLLAFYNPYGEDAGEVLSTEDGETHYLHERLPVELMKLHTRENAIRYVELTKKYRLIDEIAKEMGVDSLLLKQWVQREREWINSVARGDYDDGVIVI